MKSKLVICVCAFAAASGGAGGAAYAQWRAGDDEIVVTARKRSETLLDVPASTSVISAEAARDLVLDDAEDVLRQLPGAVATTTGAEENGDIVFRGQGAGRLGDATESATGVYRNGIYIAGGAFGGRTFNRLDLFDFERVEALRGPQGALYGRNAVGGAVNIVSARPQDEFSFRGGAGYRFNNDEVNFNGVVNLPVSDNFALRVGGFRNTQDGYIDLAGTGEDVDWRRFNGVRAAGRAMNFWGDAFFDVTLEYYSANLPSQGSVGFSESAGDPDFFTRDNLDSFGRTTIEEYRAIAEFEKSVGVGVLTMAAVYTDREGFRDGEDVDHYAPAQGPALMAQQFVRGDFEKAGAEIRLASPDSDSRWQWLLGADIQSSKEASSRYQTRLMGMTTVRPLDEAFTEDLLSASVFGSIGYDLTERLNMTVEGRVQFDDKEIDGITNVALAAGGGVIVPAGTTFALESDFTGFTPAVSLNYRVSRAHSLFARFATGYRAGGFNQAAIVRANTPEEYGREYAYSGEAGWKARLIDNRVFFELTGFYTHTDDVQVVSRVDSGIGVFILQNAGDQTLYGVEMNAYLRQPVGPGVLHGSLGFGTAQGDFADGASIVAGPGGMLQEIGGNRVNRTRDYTASFNLNYDYPIPGSDLMLTLSGGGQFEGGGFEDAPNDQVLDGFALFDARISLSADTWRLSAYGKNISNEIYVRENISGNLFLSDPRTWGVELDLSF